MERRSTARRFHARRADCGTRPRCCAGSDSRQPYRRSRRAARGHRPRPAPNAGCEPATATTTISARGIELMAKGFASTTDMAEKKITFSEIGPDLYAFTAEGDPNSAVIVGDDRCMVFDAQATPAMANKVIEPVRTVTDKPIKYVSACYCGDAHLREWPTTLNEIRAFNPKAIAPGRGDALTGLATGRDAIAMTRDFVTTLYGAAETAVAKGRNLKQTMAATREVMDPKFSDFAIYEHCLPFNVSRAFDEASGVDDPVIWTDKRDQEMWASLQGG